MDQNTSDPQPDRIVSRVRVARQVPLGQLADQAAEARAERLSIPFNSSI